MRILILYILLLASTASYARNKFVTHCTITSYNPVVAQCNSDPHHTADGTKIDMRKLKQRKIKYCAVSRDLLWILPYGTRIYIEGLGVYEVRDTMHPRWDHHIDILQHISEKNFKYEKVKVKKL